MNTTNENTGEPLSAKHLGKRVLYRDKSNDAIRQTAVRRVSPNGQWAYCAGNGMYDECLRWVQCDTITVLDVLGPADGPECQIESPEAKRMRAEYSTSI